MDNEYVMRGNSAILKCSIPSFVADFVHVTAWVDEDGKEIVASEDFTESKSTGSLHNSRSFSFLKTPFMFLTSFSISLFFN